MIIHVMVCVLVAKLHIKSVQPVSLFVATSVVMPCLRSDKHCFFELLDDK